MQHRSQQQLYTQPESSTVPENNSDNADILSPATFPVDDPDITFDVWIRSPFNR